MGCAPSSAVSQELKSPDHNEWLLHDDDDESDDDGSDLERVAKPDGMRGSEPDDTESKILQPELLPPWSGVFLMWSPWDGVRRMSSSSFLSKSSFSPCYRRFRSAFSWRSQQRALSASGEPRQRS